eukprot:Colp12_sorted_trinity150504_noHs@10172
MSCNRIPLPEGVTQDLHVRTCEDARFRYYTIYKFPDYKTNAQSGIGFFIRDLMKPLTGAVTAEEKRKFFLYGVHDTTIMPLVAAFGLLDERWAPLASMFIFELYEVATDNGIEHEVRIVYNGKAMELPFCGHRTLCNFKDFHAYVQDLLPVDPAETVRPKGCDRPE